MGFESSDNIVHLESVREEKIAELRAGIEAFVAEFLQRDGYDIFNFKWIKIDDLRTIEFTLESTAEGNVVEMINELSTYIAEQKPEVLDCWDEDDSVRDTIPFRMKFIKQSE